MRRGRRMWVLSMVIWLVWRKVHVAEQSLR